MNPATGATKTLTTAHAATAHDIRLVMTVALTTTAVCRARRKGVLQLVPRASCAHVPTMLPATQQAMT